MAVYTLHNDSETVAVKLEQDVQQTVSKPSLARRLSERVETEKQPDKYKRTASTRVVASFQ